MSLMENCSARTSTHPPAPVRPFAPNDFRRERKEVNAPVSSTTHASSIRAPPVHIPALNSDIPKHDNTIERPSHYSSQSTGAFTSPDNNIETSKIAAASPTVNAGQQERQTPLKEWQEQAEREWQSLRKRRSSVAFTAPHLQASLAKSSFLHKSESSQSFITSSQQFQSRQQQERRRQSETVFDLSKSSRSQIEALDFSTSLQPPPEPSSQSALTLAKERDASAVHRAFQTLVQRENDTVNAHKQPQGRCGSHDAVQRARSIMSISSSKMSAGGESTRGLLPDSSIEDSPRRSSEGFPSFQSSQKGASHQTKSMLVSPDISTGLSRRLETSNCLSSDEKMNQLKRSQKLATMLGGEWWREVDQDRMDRETNSSPLRGASTKRLPLLRRQSDPLHLNSMIQARKHDLGAKTSIARPLREEEQREETNVFASLRWKPLLSKRSRSSFNLKQDLLSSASTSGVTSLSPPPLDIHPKAAALLGLCLAPEPPLSEGHHLSNAAGKQKKMEKSFTGLGDNRLSSSSIELLRDSDSIMAEELEQDRMINAEESTKKMSPMAFNNAHGEDSEEDQVLTVFNREERRRRVKKISRWLGAVVPPHLILPNPENNPSQQSAASGYNIDDAPPSPMTNYMSGSPTFANEKIRTSPEALIGVAGNAAKPLIKAKAVVNAKLGKKANVETNERGLQFSSPIQQPRHAKDDNPTSSSTTFTGGEKMASVKRNHKLTAVFGEAPPQDLFTPVATPLQREFEGKRFQHRSSASLSSGPVLEGHRESQSKQPRSRHFRSDSPNSLTPLASQNCFELNSPDVAGVEGEDGSFDFASDHLASHQYRVSIDSLEYLLKEDQPLLNELVTALEEDEQAFKIQRKIGSSGASTPVAPYTTFRNVEVDETTDSSGEESRGENPPGRLSHYHHRISQASEHSEEDSCSTLEKSEEARERETKIRSHQKLGRWFGEAPPFVPPPPFDAAGSDIIYRITENGTIAARDLSTQLAPLEGGRKDATTTGKSSSSRMAPRSAGSSVRPRSLHRRALGSILNSIEGELTDDDQLTLMEKEQLRKRLWHLRSNPIHSDHAS